MDKQKTGLIRTKWNKESRFVASVWTGFEWVYVCVGYNFKDSGILTVGITYTVKIIILLLILFIQKLKLAHFLYFHPNNLKHTLDCLKFY
jgi:hypothetical protein